MPTISLKARALRYLSAREHSRVELARKLARHANEADDIELLLDQLEAARFLSNERFTESFVNRRADRYGNNRILRELRDHGIEKDALADLKAKLTEDEATRAFEVWRRKFDRSPTNSAERAKQMRFMLQRGFSHGAIQAAMRAVIDAEGEHKQDE